MISLTEAMAIKKRMCNIYHSNCARCELSKKNNNSPYICSEFMCSRSEEAEKILVKWDKENPVVTNADKFKEVFNKDLENILRNLCSGHYCSGCHNEVCHNLQEWIKAEYKEDNDEV